ncbi:hypothetical protein SDC9_166334 [bioreactor metagenome]|uniref:Uncharacterized protein n=1 Tax=bioreactor metagenome TaxID=1076179 RepID=A0A645FWQ9_9ZZZZ
MTTEHQQAVERVLAAVVLRQRERGVDLPDQRIEQRVRERKEQPVVFEPNAGNKRRAPQRAIVGGQRGGGVESRRQMRARVGEPRGQANGSLVNGGSKRAAERFGKPNANVAVERWHHTASLSIWGRTVNDRSSVSRIAPPNRG